MFTQEIERTPVNTPNDLMTELVRCLALWGSPDKLLREHSVDASGHCPTCHSVGCTLAAAARAAKQARPSS
jgi:hypothetical protein